MLKVLIAEDNVMLADILEDYLVSQGFDVCGVAGTVDGAVALADLHRPDLAVLDFRLGDGYGSQIHDLAENKDSMGILYVSGDPLKDRLGRADGEAYLQKPYGMKEVAQALRIVHEVKAGQDTPPGPFPRNFHLLGEAGGRQEAA